MPGLKRLCTVIALVAATSTLLGQGQGVTVRLSTMAPAGTTWDDALKTMGIEWEKATAGRVKLRVTGGSTQGTQSTVIRYMRPEINQVDAALLTAGGLAEVDPGFNVYGIPFFFQSDAEEQAVRQKLEPLLVKRLEAKHFHLLSWGHGGWVQLFSTVQIKTLTDLKNAKLWTSAGDTEMIKWYTSNGFHPVAQDVTGILAGLRTGTINATPMPPYGAVSLQLGGVVKYMLDINVDPLIGALIMTDAAWDKIDAGDRDKIVAAAKAMGATLQTKVPAQDALSVKAMQLKGLTVTTLDPAATATLRGEADKLAATMRGNMVPADIYDLALQARDAFRKSHGH